MKAFISFGLAVTLTGCLLDNERKPGKTYKVNCAGHSDSTVYNDSTGTTTSFVRCEYEEPKPEPMGGDQK